MTNASTHKAQTMNHLKVLVGVCGIGYGHMIRQSLVIEQLRQRGAQVAVFSFSKSFEYLKRHRSPDVPFWDVHVPWVYTDNRGINWDKTEQNEINHLEHRYQLRQMAVESAKNFFNGLPDICISDYEPISAGFAYENEIPLITIDQQSKFLGFRTEPLGEYCREEERSRLNYFFPYAAARFACSFYTVQAEPDPDYQIELIPAPIRREITILEHHHYRLQRSHPVDQHIVIYFSPYGPISQNLDDIVGLLSKCKDWHFHVYADPVNGVLNMRSISPNIQFKEFDRRSFAHDLHSASALVSTAGHTLLSEAVYLKIPVYTLPLSTYDQHYCGNMIEKHNIGLSDERLSESRLHQFLSDLPLYRGNLLDNPNLTVSENLPDQLFDSILHVASTHAKGRKVRGSCVSTVSHTSPVKDHLYLPDLDKILTEPGPPYPPQYTTAVIKPTMRCTYNCIACESRAKGWWKSDAKSMSLGQWKVVIAQIKTAGFQSVTISGGEPLIYPHLVELVQAISAQDLVPVLNTNGVRLSSSFLKRLYDAGLKGINFSLDSPWPSVHDTLRRHRGAWQHCIEAIRNAGEYEDRIWFAIRMILSTRTMLDLPEMIQLAANLKASSLKISYLEWCHPGNPLLPTVETLRKFKESVIPVCEVVLQSLDTPGIQKEKSITILRDLLYSERINSLENYSRGIYWSDISLARHCKIPYSLAIIGGDGCVLPCNASEYARIALPGNLLETPLDAILGSPAMNHFRENPPAICQYCPMPLHLTLPLRDTIQ
jgi:uncharacterized protein (TIGR00661 family)